MAEWAGYAPRLLPPLAGESAAFVLDACVGMEAFWGEWGCQCPHRAVLLRGCTEGPRVRGPGGCCNRSDEAFHWAEALESRGAGGLRVFRKQDSESGS